jgi:hypothetical protein
MGTGSFLEGKRQGCGVDHPPPSRAEVKKEYNYYLLPLAAFVACSRVHFNFLDDARSSARHSDATNSSSTEKHTKLIYYMKL